MERRLVAILAADVIGYGRLMGKDKAGILEGARSGREELISVQIARA